MRSYFNAWKELDWIFIGVCGEIGAQWWRLQLPPKASTNHIRVRSTPDFSSSFCPINSLSFLLAPPHLVIVEYKCLPKYLFPFIFGVLTYSVYILVMALNFPSVPLSPGSQALMTLFTTINDTDPQPNEIDNTHLSKSVTLSTSLVPQPNLARRGALEGSDTTIAHEAEGEPQIRDSVPNKRISRAPKRRSMAATFQQQRLPGYICFSSTSGELVNGSKRSTFPQKRREEVKRVRERGACLRCQIRKISCSEGDPCRECLSLLQAKMGSKALMWMECIRLTIPELSPFERGMPNPSVSR